MAMGNGISASSMNMTHNWSILSYNSVTAISKDIRGNRIIKTMRSASLNIRKLRRMKVAAKYPEERRSAESVLPPDAMLPRYDKIWLEVIEDIQFIEPKDQNAWWFDTYINELQQCRNSSKTMKLYGEIVRSSRHYVTSVISISQGIGEFLLRQGGQSIFSNFRWYNRIVQSKIHLFLQIDS